MKRKTFPLLILKRGNQFNSFKQIRCGAVQIVMTSRPVEIESGHQDEHDFFEFLIPMSHLSGFFVGSQQIDCHIRELVPINPGMKHGFHKRQKAASYILILIDQRKMDSLIREVTANTFSCRFPIGSYAIHTDIQLLLSRLITESRESECGSDLLTRCLADELALLLIRHYHDVEPVPRRIIPKSLTEGQARFQHVIDYLQENFGQKIAIEDMAELADMNYHYFVRVFKAAMGYSPYQYLLMIRCENAKIMLTCTEMTASQIAKACGFASASRFSMFFAKETGLTPIQYRRQQDAGWPMVDAHEK